MAFYYGDDPEAIYGPGGGYYDDDYNEEYDDFLAADEDFISGIQESLADSYSRSLDIDNPSQSSVRWNDQALETLLGGIGYGVLPNFLDELRDLANSQAITEGALYASAVHTPDNRHGTDFPPGGYIYTKNYEARLDEVYHSTLLKVIDRAKSILERSGMSTSSGESGLPPGVTASTGKDGRVRYHGINPKTGKYGFVKNPYK